MGAEDSSPSNVLPGNELDQFERIKMLGSGGGGFVWKAKNKATGEIIALKECNVKKFLKEVREARKADFI